MLFVHFRTCNLPKSCCSNTSHWPKYLFVRSKNQSKSLPRILKQPKCKLLILYHTTSFPKNHYFGFYPKSLIPPPSSHPCRGVAQAYRHPCAPPSPPLLQRCNLLTWLKPTPRPHHLRPLRRRRHTIRQTTHATRPRHAPRMPMPKLITMPPWLSALCSMTRTACTFPTPPPSVVTRKGRAHPLSIKMQTCTIHLTPRHLHLHLHPHHHF